MMILIKAKYISLFLTLAGIFLLFLPIAYGVETTADVDASASISVESLPVDVVIDPRTGQPLPHEEARRQLDMKARAQGQIDVRTNVLDRASDVQNRLQGVRTSTTNQIEQIRTDLRARLGNATSSIKQRFEEQRTRISGAAYERARAFLERVIRQLGAAHERLSRITDRIEERIVKLKDMGATTADAEAGLQVTREHLVEAEVAIDLAASALAAAPTTTSPDTVEDDRVTLGEVRDLIHAAQEALKATRESLRDLLDLVRLAASTLPDTASITAEAALEN